VLGQQPADDGSYGERKGGHSGPGSDRLAALVRGERVRDDRQRRGHHQRCPDSLHGSAGDKRRGVGGEATTRRRRGEQHDADQEGQSTTEDVPEAPAGDEQYGERERVDVHGPLQAGQ
jgi:hypothetical protein